MTTPNTNTALQKREEKDLMFVPFGAVDKIKLNVTLVRNYLATPTRSGRMPTDRDCTRFMMLCYAKGLNPWEGDAFLVGYDTDVNGVKMAQFSQITAHQAFLKRAELNPEYDGMKSGIILLNEDETTTTDREGDFHLPNEIVVGGWATVFFKTRKYPITRRIRMNRFNTGYAEWKKDPAGMSVKCAEADALRSAFPTKFSGLYLKEEQADLPTIDLVPAGVAVGSKIEQLMPPEQEQQHPVEQERGAQQQPEPPVEQKGSATKSAKLSPQEELGDFIIRECGCTFDHFLKWGRETGQLTGDMPGSFDEIPTDLAKRLLRAKAGLAIGVKLAKGVA